MPVPGLTSERWQRIAGLVDMALELERPLRAAWLETITQRDPELRRQVYDVLRHFGAEGFAREPRTDMGDTARSAPEDPDRVGPYRLLRVLGRGGMGVVHLAERVDQFERQVAIKIIAGGYDAPIVHQRFLAERQILARFDHPHIARLFGGGSTADGRPYFVMEFVDGPPIDRFCCEKKLGLDQRLDLFVKVCSATAYAHQRLVVHRDLKPSNILVGADGQPKLLDFGIAKLLDPAAMPFPLEATRLGSRPMTLGYAAPEQMTGEAVSTASDVFALGILLYVLLTDRLPFELRADQARDQQLAILRQKPVEPSVVLRESVLEGVANTAGWSSHDLASVAGQVEGDLDAIVAKALRYETAERYGAVADLIEDLERYRQGKPVAASRATPLYLAGKFIRRYRFTVGASATLVLLLLVFSIVTERQARLLEQERDRSAEEATRATHTRDFLADILRAADRVSLEDDRVPLKTLLDLGLERIEQGDIPDSQVRADLLVTLGESYEALRDFASAARSFEAAIATPSQEDGTASPGALHRRAGMARLLQGDLKSARIHFEDALTLIDDDPDTRIELRRLIATAPTRPHSPAHFATMIGFFEEVGAGRAETHIGSVLFMLQLWTSALLEIGHDEPAQTILWRIVALNRLRGIPADTFLSTVPILQASSTQPEKGLAGFRFLYGDAGLRRFEESRLSQGREDAGSLVPLMSYALLEAQFGSLTRAESLRDRLSRGVERLLAVNAADARAGYLKSYKYLIEAHILERLGLPERAELERRQAYRLGLDLYQVTQLKALRMLMIRSLLASGRIEEARPLIAQLIQSGYRPGILIHLATVHGALPSSMPPQPVLPQLPAWVEAWLPAEGEVPPWEQVEEVPSTPIP
jgi:serine/threonine protein kinase